MFFCVFIRDHGSPGKLDELAMSNDFYMAMQQEAKSIYKWLNG